MSLAYERVASFLIGTPLQQPAEWLRGWKGRAELRRHPEMGEIARESARVDAAMSRTLRPGMNCIDIGCHLGSHLLKIVRGAPGGRHFAFEPVDYKARWLRRKFPRVAVLTMALGEENGRADFFVDDRASACSSLKPAPVAPGVAMHGTGVDVRRLDDVVPQATRIGFVKIDVNGGELPVLRGAKRILSEDRPAILVECTQRGLQNFGVEPRQVHDFVTREAGYEVYLLKDWLAGAAPIDVGRFARSMTYPFEAFSYWLVPRRTSN